MEPSYVTVSVRGRAVRYPAIRFGERTIFATGTWPKIARVRDEEWLESEPLPEPERAIERLKAVHFAADILTFTQKVPDVRPRFAYPRVNDSVAAVRTTDYSRWWSALPQETRKNVRRAARRGIAIREVAFDDALVQGIVGVNNETPVRQGRAFWHYGKSFEVVRDEYSSFLDRCQFIGAYHEDVLVGFIKLVFMRETAAILQLLCMQRHADNRPANALLERAVRNCADSGVSHLLYGKFVYGRNVGSPLTEFKRRNGFEEILVPRYYAPLNASGALAIRTGMHLGLKQALPEPVLGFARRARSKWIQVQTSFAQRGVRTSLRSGPQL
jgi:hypothetical protein